MSENLQDASTGITILPTVTLSTSAGSMIVSNTWPFWACVTSSLSVSYTHLVVLLGGRALDSGGEMLSGPAAAAAVAAVIAATADPAIPLNGAPLEGISGVAADFSDDEIDLLVRGGVTPLEGNAGIASPVRGVTTRTTTGGASDSTWRELSTVLIVDNVIPQIRSALRRTFNRAKNTAQTRSAVRSRVIVELENKRQAEIIDGYGDVTVRASEENATVCEVEFSFAVAHGLNQIYLTAHITI